MYHLTLDLNLIMYFIIKFQKQLKNWKIEFLLYIFWELFLFFLWFQMQCFFYAIPQDVCFNFSWLTCPLFIFIKLKKYVEMLIFGEQKPRSKTRSSIWFPFVLRYIVKSREKYPIEVAKNASFNMHIEIEELWSRMSY